jgi:NodT family efflux transporter outer membrane factor (OMF) lipoprotein
MNATIRVTGFAIAAIVGGCSVGPNYHAPQMDMPSKFGAATTQPAASYSAALPSTSPAASQSVSRPTQLELSRWWESLNDPELNSLIKRSIVANPDLHIAVNRLQEARENLAVFVGDSLPYVEASAGAGVGSGTNSTKGRVSAPLNAATNTGGYKEITQVLGFDAAWEVDLFGQLRREVEAQKADSLAALDFRNQVLVTLTGDVAVAYIEVRTLQARVEINKQAIDVQRNTADFARGRFQQGFVSELDADLAERELYAFESTLAPLEAQLAAAKRAVAVLLGEFPEDLGKELDQTAPLPQPPAELPTGLPAELLRRRPDVRLAEYQLIAANAQIGVATANLYPQVFLTAGGGWQGQGLGRTPLLWNGIWSVGPAVRWALFDFGTLDAAVKIEDFHTREVLWNYRKSVIVAVQEVDNALQSYDAERMRLSELEQALTAAQRALTVANGRYKRGIIDFLNVLDAQRQLFALQDQYALSEDQTVTQFIAVCKALGGGWEGSAPPPPPAAPRPAIIAAGADALSLSHRPVEGSSYP